MRFAVYRKRLYAACCSFEVVNGGGGLRRFSLLRNARNLPVRLADRGDNLVGGFLIGDFDVLAFVLAKLGFEERRLPGIEHRVDAPIFLRNERANLHFALND